MEQIVKTRDVEKFVSETKYFLDEFDSIISHWDLSGNFFLHYLIEIHENVTQLLARFTTLSLEGVGDRKSKPFFNLKCCGLKSALLKLAFFNRRANEYVQYGTVADRYLCLYLKKILKKIIITLDTFNL
ncbi:hypothetical protein ZHAS_00004307 [Anopheles sinensis]|uniref:Uncharacterized protein n=1 Tax=Anopheles sinensis TaxID=74873 RepID=A0A084VGL2_ANOSI|nr:hypothetical protein ZHAS_00004307 [Anopheles sinensis]